MNYQNSLMHAVDTVLAWDLPDETFPTVVNDLARLMAGIAPEEDPPGSLDYH